jgi:glycosyltransferase involved in cell wall biosynthesis
MQRPSEDKKPDILVLEPYYGGSHKSFLAGLQKHIPFNFHLITLPARKWKWRMRLAAPYFAERLHRLNKGYDRILCSTFVDVATFRGLAPAWCREVPLLTYFHENQFAYPVQVDDERDFHFALTNVTTALASDRVAFNSEYNLRTFLDGIKKLLKKSHDLKLADAVRSIKSKSTVIPPGIDFSMIDRSKKPDNDGPPVIVWNHRWEHDKNPELFFKTLVTLDKKGVDFRVIVLGESFKEHPSVFETVQKKLSKEILQFGYAKTRGKYARWLRRGDIVVSTANHEFFGISVLEAVRAGCRPFLPNRLSYPGLVPDQYLYEENNFLKRLQEEITKKSRLSQDQSLKLTDRFSWSAVAPAFKTWIQYCPKLGIK